MRVQSQRVTDNPNNNTIFMVWNFKETDQIKKVFKQICALVVNLNNSATVRFPNSSVSCVMGIGFNAWKKVQLREPLPKELEEFKEIKGNKHTAVSTPGDLHFHIRSNKFSVCFDMASAISDVLFSFAECIEEIHGFRYWDGRSILGFVDGTENPQGKERDFFSKVGKEDEKYMGGSYLFVQKYIHDMKAWNNLSVKEQENVIGRYKASDIEMSNEVKPVNSHSALANVGDDLKVVRDNMPFRSNYETGTYFIAYANTFTTLRKMLENMFIGNPVGNYDRILDFSTAKTGSLFFVPTIDMLAEFSS